MIRGVDVASFQGFPGQWRAEAGRIRFAAVKLTELMPDGTRYVNPDAAADWDWLRHEGHGRVGYLFGHPAAPPAATVDLFGSVLAGLGLADGDGICLDLEVTDGRPPHEVDAWAAAVLSALRREHQRVPLVYTFLSFAEDGNCASLGGYPLWIADPSSPEGQPRVPAPWRHWAIHQYDQSGGIDRDLAVFSDLAAMAAAVGRAHGWADYTTTGRESLVAIAAAAGSFPLRILERTAEHAGPHTPHLAGYVNAGDLHAPMPAGIVLRVPAGFALATRRKPVRAAALAVAAGGRAAGRGAAVTVRREPVAVAGAVTGLLGAAVPFVLPHLGVHLTAARQAAVLTILTALAVIWAAAAARPVRVPVIYGSLATAATACAAFGLHVPAAWLGGQMPLAALAVALVMRSHVSPRAFQGDPGSVTLPAAVPPPAAGAGQVPAAPAPARSAVQGVSNAVPPPAAEGSGPPPVPVPETVPGVPPGTGEGQ